MDNNQSISLLQDILLKGNVKQYLNKTPKIVELKDIPELFVYQNGIHINAFVSGKENYLLPQEAIKVSLEAEDTKIVLKDLLTKYVWQKIVQTYWKSICFLISWLFADISGRNKEDVLFFYYLKEEGKFYEMHFFLNKTEKLSETKIFPIIKKVLDEKKVELNEHNGEVHLFKNINNYKEYEHFFIGNFSPMVQERIKKYNYKYNTFLSLYEQDLTSLKLVNGLSIDKLFNAIEKNKRILIFGDYDSDGFNSMIILYKLFNFIGYKNFKFLFPTRKDSYIGLLDEVEHKNPFIWYGVRDVILDYIQPDDLLFTVDNGGFQLDTLQKVKEKGNEILVIDHHNLNYDSWKYKNDKKFRAKEVNVRENGLKTNKKETAFFIDTDYTYTHPLIEADFNLISASAITYMFAQEFFKKALKNGFANSRGITQEQITAFLKNVVFHGAIGDITDVMSLLPVEENYWRKVYEAMTEILSFNLEMIEKKVWLTPRDLFNPYSLSTSQESTRKDFLNKYLFTPYEKQGNRTIYSGLNKEVFTMMLYKGITNLEPDDIGYMIWPIINIFGRLSSVEELFKLLASFTEKDQASLTKTLEEFKKITLINTIRNNTVAVGQKDASQYLKLFKNIATNTPETFMPENLFQIIFINTDRFYSFGEYVKNKNMEAKKIAIPKEDKYFYDNGIFSFVGSFNGLVSGKVSEKYVLSNFVLSCVTSDIHNGEIHFEGSGRWVGTVNLNELLQFFITNQNLINNGIHIVWGGHNDAVGVHVSFSKFPKWDEKEVYRRIGIINQEYNNFLIKKHKENPDFLKGFYDALIGRKTELLYKSTWRIEDLNILLGEVYNNLYVKYKFFWTDFELPKINVKIKDIISLILSLNIIGKKGWEGKWYTLLLDTFMKKDIKEIFLNKETAKLEQLFEYVKLVPYEKGFLIKI